MNAHDFTVTTADGSMRSLRDYQGRVVLVVNVASKCGLTPQYEGLEALYRESRERGLEILGFPCNQFGGQEPGSDADIQEFCSVSYDVTFPVLKKVDVNGPGAEPLFAYLRAEAPGDFGPEAGRLWDHISTNRPEMLGTDAVKWNFTKFLIAPDGQVVRRYEPTVTPEEIRADLDALLPDAQDEAGLDPPVIASDYPSETGPELAAESAYEQVHPDVIDHTPGGHPDMPFERAADYPAQPGEELAHRHGE